jgi:hypothetical protein
MNEYDIVAQPGDIYWEIPEYIKHERTRAWYIVAGTVVIGMMIYALMTSNYLFLGILFLGSFITIMNDLGHPNMLPVVIGDEGVRVGKRLYDYDEISNFSIVYKPKDEIKNVYIEFKSPVKQRLSLPLMDQNPLVVREALLRFLPEDLERTNVPTSEGLAKLLKL